jgi:hypothetical protein
MPIAQAHAQREALTAHAETQEHLLEIIMPICAVPIGRPRRDRPCDWAGLLFIGSVQGERRRILMEPGGREGIDREGVEGDSPKHTVQKLRSLSYPLQRWQWDLSASEDETLLAFPPRHPVVESLTLHTEVRHQTQHNVMLLGSGAWVRDLCTAPSVADLTGL